MSRLGSLMAVIATFLASSASANSIAEFRQSWTYQALSMQQQLDMDVPLARIMIPHSHNSYNSRAYATIARYHDPNHYKSIAEQLLMGFRSLEFDVHYFLKMDGWPWQWRNELLLCHGTSAHLGCSNFDRRFRDGLAEIARFLADPAHRDELIILYIEDHMDDRYQLAIQEIQQTIGHLVYRPKQETCQGIPMNLTKRDILASGKNLVLMGGRDVCQSNSGWSSWAFAGVGSFTGGSYPTASIHDFADGNCFNRYSFDYFQNHWIRVQEDRTYTTKLFGGGGVQLEYDDIRQLVSCGVNLVGFDKVHTNDQRLEALIWSWAPSEPKISYEQSCAGHGSDGRFRGLDCGQPLPFACRTSAGTWRITQSAGHWFEGNDICQWEASASFDLPENGFDNKLLQETKRAYGIDQVWLNYQSPNGSRHWLNHSAH